MAHTLDVISVPHASILSVEVIQRDDALVLVLTTRSYKAITFSSRSATNRDWSWCRSEWQWRAARTASMQGRRPSTCVEIKFGTPHAIDAMLSPCNLAHWLISTQVVTADHDDGDDVDDDTELLSKLGLGDLDDRALRRNRLKRFIEPQEGAGAVTKRRRRRPRSRVRQAGRGDRRALALHGREFEL